MAFLPIDSMTSDTLTRSLGWAQYSDGQYSEASPFTILQGQTSSLPNNAASVIDSQLPEGSLGLYDGARITPDSAGDAYILRVNFTAETSSNNGAFSISLDISAAGDGSISILNSAERFVRGINTPQLYTKTFLIYSLGTFLANGGILRFESIAGDTNIYGISYVIAKVNSG